MESLPPGIRRILPLLRSSTAAAIHHHSKNETPVYETRPCLFLDLNTGVGADGKGGSGPMAGDDQWCKKGEFSLCSLFLLCSLSPVFLSPLLYFPLHGILKVRDMEGQRSGWREVEGSVRNLNGGKKEPDLILWTFPCGKFDMGCL